MTKDEEEVLDNMLEELENIEDKLDTMENQDENKEKDKKFLINEDGFSTTLTSKEKLLYENIGFEFAKGGLERIQKFLKAKEKEEELSTFGKKIPSPNDIKKDIEKTKKKEKGSWFNKLLLTLGILGVAFYIFKDKISEFFEELRGSDGIIGDIVRVFDPKNENSIVSKIREAFSAVIEKLRGIGGVFGSNFADASDKFVDKTVTLIDNIVGSLDTLFKEIIRVISPAAAAAKKETEVIGESEEPTVQKITKNSIVLNNSFNSDDAREEYFNISNSIQKITNNESFDRNVLDSTMRGLLLMDDKLLTYFDENNALMEDKVKDEIKYMMGELDEKSQLYSYFQKLLESVESKENITPKELKKIIQSARKQTFSFSTQQLLKQGSNNVNVSLVKGNVKQEELNAHLQLEEIRTTNGQNESEKLIQVLNFKKEFFNKMFDNVSFKVNDFKAHELEIKKHFESLIESGERKLINDFIDYLDGKVQNSEIKIETSVFTISPEEFNNFSETVINSTREEIEILKEQETLMKKISEKKSSNSTPPITPIVIQPQQQEASYSSGNFNMLRLRNSAFKGSFSV